MLAPDPNVSAKNKVEHSGSSGELVGESLGVTLLHPAGAALLRAPENQNKNPSGKEKQRAFCALPLVGPEQDASEERTELAGTGTSAARQFHGLGAGFVGRFRGGHRGDTGRRSTATPKMIFGTGSVVTLKSQAGSTGSKMWVLTC